MELRIGSRVWVEGHDDPGTIVEGPRRYYDMGTGKDLDESHDTYDIEFGEDDFVDDVSVGDIWLVK